MNISIYQINLERDSDRVAFMALGDVPRFQGSAEINAEIYDKVFTGEVDCKNLKDVYEKFNIDHPQGYKGRSLSVSDIVEIAERDKESRYYYCDSFGFKEVRFDAEFAHEAESDTIRVVMVEPGKLARVCEMGRELEDLQAAVGGYIEAYYPFDENVCIVCNDKGKISGMPLNRAIRDEDGRIADIIAGPFFICDCSGENFGSLSSEQLDRYAEKYKYPERFCRDIFGEIQALPYSPQKNERER